MLRTSEQPFSSVLGLKWIPDIDVFSYLMHTPSSNYTKRTLLSSIAQIYDPCGWISPIVFWSKVLMQHVWTLGLDWDSPLTDHISEKWSRFVKELPEIEKLRIPCFISLTTAVNIQLHGFSDGSESGYAACVLSLIHI